MNEQRNLRDAVDGWATRILAAWQKTVSNIVETGQALIDAKADLDHGAFLKMVEGRLPFQRRTAERLMTIASHSVLSNASHASHLPASWMTLAELARLDASTVERLIESGEINPRLERKGVARLLPPPKPKAIPKKAAPAAKPRQTGPVFARPVVIKSEIVPPVMYVPPKTVEPEITPPPKFVYPAPAKSAGPVIEGEIIPYDEAVREGRRLVEQLKIEAPEEFEDEPDPVPPIVHVDPPAPLVGDVMVEHLREELAARDEEIEGHKAHISSLISLAEEKDCEIVELRAARASLEDRVRRLEIERADEFANFLLHYCGRDDVETKALMEGAKEFIPGVFEALERSLAARQEPAPEPVEEPAPPIPLTWGDFLEAYSKADDHGPLDGNSPEAHFVRWADAHGFDIDGYAGAPSEVKRLWLLVAKNCSVHSVARNIYQETSAVILKRYGSGRRVSVATMATDLKCRQKDIANTLDVMFQFDFDGLLVREKVGRETLWTIRRPTKEVAQ